MSGSDTAAARSTTAGDGEPGETVRLELAGAVATLTLDRPPLNVLDIPTLRRLDQTLGRVEAHQGELHLLVVRGAGERAFSAGVAIEDHVPEKIEAMLESFHRALRRLFSLDLLTVAAVDGHCLGGGMELALTCDMVVATRRSSFGQPEIRLGCFPPVAAVLLPRRIGAARAADLLTTGRRIQAKEAERLGLSSRLADDGRLDDALRELSEAILAQSRAALRCTKKAFRRGQPEPELFETALAEVEEIYLGELTTTADMAEGIEAFLQKRPPRWRHS